MPTKKQKTTSEDGGKPQPAQAHADIADVHLPGEETDSVPIYDTCDDVRRKITAYLGKPGVTQASFLRELGAQYFEPKKLQTSQLQRFRGNKGAYAGNTSLVYYAAYVFFEKIRVKEGKPKSKKRLEVEEFRLLHGGIPTDHRMTHFLVRAGSKGVHIDPVGRIFSQ